MRSLNDFSERLNEIKEVVLYELLAIIAE